MEPGLVLPMVGRGLGLSGERVRTASAHRQLTPRSCALPAPSQVASHNTVRMRFDIESADYLHLHKPDASFPHRHYSMLADVGRCEVRAKLVSARSNPHAACVLHAPTGLHAPHQCRRTSAPLRARCGGTSRRTARRTCWIWGAAPASCHSWLRGLGPPRVRIEISGRLCCSAGTLDRQRFSCAPPPQWWPAICTSPCATSHARQPRPTACPRASRSCTATPGCCSAGVRCARWASTWWSPTCSMPVRAAGLPAPSAGDLCLHHDLQLHAL